MTLLPLLRMVPEPRLDAEVRSTETREHAKGMRSNPHER